VYINWKYYEIQQRRELKISKFLTKEIYVLKISILSPNLITSTLPPNSPKMGDSDFQPQSLYFWMKVYLQ